MKDYLVKHEWKIVEDRYHPEHNQISESIMSLGNGKMGQRANYEEEFTGNTLQGTYLAGVYYPDKTKVGWWKNGYPEYFAKVLNAVNWIGLNITINGEELDIAKAKKVQHFERVLDMQKGLLSREMTVELVNGLSVKVLSHRICSMHEDELGCLSYSIEVLNADATVAIESVLDFTIVNTDSNYDESFWLTNDQSCSEVPCVVANTKKTDFEVAAAMVNRFSIDGEEQQLSPQSKEQEKFVSNTYHFELKQGQKLTLEKYAVITSSLNYAKGDTGTAAIQKVTQVSSQSFEEHLQEHAAEWDRIWRICDIEIKGDVSAQQGIRFNIFQLFQTYTGKDSRLNIGPKGFTGEKYGGSTYWDTEAYCLPFYLGTADSEVARNLLIYRYNHLQKAIENAEKLGFTDGAALYPMVTMNGEECHNEWEITFEEIHRNGAIAYAIYDYIRYTNDKRYLVEYGGEVLLGIARFWAQRVNWSEKRKQFVMLGVTGPNEYENNVNNNWYTNYIAVWCLKYATEALQYIEKTDHTAFQGLVQKTNFGSQELDKWKHIIENMYFPTDSDLGIYLQQDNYLDKEQILVEDLPAEDRPLNQKWSWDRILRSCFIKQADVLQGLYFFEEDFDEETHKKNFLFYEPRTVHESSLSPCVHSILASKLGMSEKAYEMYLRTSRLDLDDYNNDTEDGCHITSMAGTWLAIIKGFAGQRLTDGVLSFAPSIPSQWEEVNFKIKRLDNLFNVSFNQRHVEIQNLEGPNCEIMIYGQKYLINAGDSLEVSSK